MQKIIYPLGFVSGVIFSLPVVAQTTPNLLFIMADQYRGDALGCIGKEPVKLLAWITLLPKVFYLPTPSAVIRFHLRQEPC